MTTRNPLAETREKQSQAEEQRQVLAQLLRARRAEQMKAARRPSGLFLGLLVGGFFPGMGGGGRGEGGRGGGGGGFKGSRDT